MVSELALDRDLLHLAPALLRGRRDLHRVMDVARVALRHATELGAMSDVLVHDRGRLGRLGGARLHRRALHRGRVLGVLDGVQPAIVWHALVLVLDQLLGLPLSLKAVLLTALPSLLFRLGSRVNVSSFKAHLSSLSRFELAKFLHLTLGHVWLRIFIDSDSANSEALCRVLLLLDAAWSIHVLDEGGTRGANRALHRLELRLLYSFDRVTFGLSLLLLLPERARRVCGVAIIAQPTRAARALLRTLAASLEGP